VATFANQKSETARLVPHSGLQFITLGLNVETTPNFARTFIGHKFADQAAADGVTVPMELLPGWNEDDPVGEPPHERQGEDDEYRVSKERAIDAFGGGWVPVPFLATRAGLDAQGHEIFEHGPIDWARLRLFPAEPGTVLDGAPITHHVVIAFDTEILDREQGHYVAPTAENVRNEQEFAFASRFSDVMQFLASGATQTPERENARAMTWVEQWVFDMFVAARERQLKRRMREEEKKTVEHLARYVTLLQFINAAVAIPRIKLVDTYSDARRTRPIAVDLVLDIGNSRTCGILIETYPNDTQMSFANTVVLELRNLSEPFRVYREPFESHIEFAQTHFGSERLSKLVRSKPSFFWPSPLRIGPEAEQFREAAEATVWTSGMSSPKRYLCDLLPRNQGWYFQPGDYDQLQTPPLVARRLYQFVNARGDVRRQVDEDKPLYGRLAALLGPANAQSTAATLTFARSSIFSFMLCEVIAQAWSMINNWQFRKARGDREAPRELKRIFLSLPTAMPIQEQRILRSRAEAAVKLMWDLMGWTALQSGTPPLPSDPRPPQPPTVRVSWDEATCTQLVYLYNEIVDKFAGNVGEFFELMGKPRPLFDPEMQEAPKIETDPDRSLRIASVDVGGGTTDLMITTYHVEGGRALVPVQNFREGFRIAGDEVLREIIQQAVLQPLAAHLREAGVASPHEFLTDRFGGDKAGMDEADRQLRRLFVQRVLQPAGLGVIRAAEAATYDNEERIETTTLGALIGKAGEGGSAITPRIRDYVEAAARKWGAAASFSLEACPIPINIAGVRAAVAASLGGVFDNIAEAINALDCDVVLLSGRPTRMPATIELFVDKLAIAPDRVVPLSRYQVGKWYPFASRASFRIDDPKTATAVGCLLGVLVERQITNFTAYTNRFTMRSTAKYLGELESDGKLLKSRVRFEPTEVSDEANFSYFAQMRIGYRQLPIERWTASPLYRLKVNSKDRIRGEVTVTLGRSPSEKAAELDDPDNDEKKIAQQEAWREELQVVNAERKADGGNMKPLVSLQLETLPSEAGYWLDTGILRV